MVSALAPIDFVLFPFADCPIAFNFVEISSTIPNSIRAYTTLIETNNSVEEERRRERIHRVVNKVRDERVVTFLMDAN